MRLGHSILQTASMVRRVWLALATATHHTIFNSSAQAAARQAKR